MSFENRNYAFAGAFVDELARCGLRHVCICPGSRSTPLTVSFARHPSIKTWVHLDERSASFFALGMARALGEPVAVVCSSGTAAANLFPAVVEAHADSVPLLVLTADRPPELVGWGALQTIDQTRLYGSHAKWSVTMPPPEATADLMGFVRSTACRAFATASASPAGPVHLDFPFRDPLEPVVVPADFTEGAEAAHEEAWRGRSDGQPFLHVPVTERRPTHDDVARLARELGSMERGVIVCGPQPDPALAEAVALLARCLDYPILADPLSQVRCGSHNRSLMIDCYDAFLRDAELASYLAPQVVFRFGAVLASRPLTQYLERHRTARHILVEEGDGWRDPFRLTSHVLYADPVALCTELVSALGECRGAGAWSERWRKVAGVSQAVMQRELDGLSEMFEGKLFSQLARLLPDDAVLFVGNSMPIRDVDSFFPSLGRRIRFLANRGASGIDGVVSSALGASAVSRGKLVLVLGDLSFYHDMNGLLAAKAHGLDATIIVVNNNGGGIFSFLPQAAYEEVFEPYFGTPHGLTFRAAAELYGLRYCVADDWGAFDGAVRESLARSDTDIIEVPGDRRLNVALHRRVWAAVAAGVRISSGR